jgi:phenylacetate-CoA ligase
MLSCGNLYKMTYGCRNKGWSFGGAAFKLKFELMQGGSGRLFRDMMQVRELPLNEVMELNWQRRKAIAGYAYERVPYYRQKWDKAGFHPDMLKSEEDWARVPILEKEELRTYGEQFRAEGVPKRFLRLSTTGGSTGVPLKVYHDGRFPLRVIGWRHMNAWGMVPWDNAAYVLRNTRSSGWKSRLNALLWYPTRRALMDASSFTENDVRRFVERMNKIRPVCLHGYVGAVEQVASMVRTMKLDVWQPRFVWVTSSPITPSGRQLIASVFHCPVYDQYGCGEIFWLAAEEPGSPGLVADYDVRHIEFVDEGGGILPWGQAGRSLLTDLTNRAFPIIRYANGDAGSFLPANRQPSKGLPFLAPVKGRVTDNLLIPGGGFVAGDYLTTLFDNAPHAVQAFQIRQNSADFAVQLRVVPSSAPDSTREIEEVVKRLAVAFQNKVSITVVKMDSIPSDRGKRRYVIRDQ